MSGVQARAAVHWGETAEWSIETIDIAAPRPGEVLVRMLAAGLCHTDLALVNGSYPSVQRPVIGGHEGIGVVAEVGAGVDLVEGDHVLFLIPVPPCGRCRSCLAGWTHLCETSGAQVAAGRQVSDGTARHRLRGQDIGIFVLLGLFADYALVNEASVLKIAPDLSPVEYCTVSCAGVTGWGAVRNSAQLQSGEVAVVVGVGGVGANAIQAARYLGAGAVLAVDPLPARRQLALDLGADDAVANLDTAQDRLAEWTNGRMADAVLMTAGPSDTAMMSGGLAALGRRGRLVVVNVHPDDSGGVTLPLRELQEHEKQIRGCHSGSWHGRHGAAFLLDLAARGHYNPGAIVSRTYPLAEIERGYAEQARGDVVRAVLDLAP